MDEPKLNQSVKRTFWIVAHFHEYGNSFHPVFDKEPTLDEAENMLFNYEPDKGEYVDVDGPFFVPEVTE